MGYAQHSLEVTISNTFGRANDCVSRCWEGEQSSKMPFALLPAFVVLSITLIISVVTGNPEGLFLSRSAWGILARFVITTPVLIIPIGLLPKILTRAGRFTKSSIFGQLVKSKATPLHEFTVSNDLVLRPLQGMALSLIFTERFLDFLAFSTGTSYSSFILASTVFAFLMVNPLISLFLSFVWTFDDLCIKVYNKRTDEARMLGRSIGIAIPLITGAIGTFTLFHRTQPIDALIDLLGTLMVLYPPYVLCVIFHHQFIKSRFIDLSQRLPFDRLETRIKHVNNVADKTFN